MQIESIGPKPIYFFAADSTAPGGGPESVEIPVLSAVADVPESLDALLVIGDLQAVGSADVPIENRELLGVQVARELAQLADFDLLPNPSRTGVILTGDLYTASDLITRGATGDVQNVWAAFSNRFAWLVGVAGNHDLFRGRHGCDLPSGLSGRAELLRGRTSTRSGLNMAGVSGIIGETAKPWRSPEPKFLAAVRDAVAAECDILVLHEAPCPPDGSEKGNVNLMSTIISTGFEGTVVFGHVHWLRRLRRAGPMSLLNVNACAVYLTRAPLAPL